MRSLVVMVALGLALACAATAEAGVYEVRSCGSSSVSAFVLANDSPQSITTGAQCPQSGSQLLSGMYAGVMNSTFTLAGSGASWTISAPSGLLLQRLDVRRSIGRLSSAWHVEASTPGRVLESCGAGDPSNCKRGNAGGENTSYTDLGSPSVSFWFECRPSDADTACVGRPTTQAWVAIYSASAQVADPAPPTVSPLTGAEGWQTGTDRVEFSASDASGVKSMSLFAGDTKLSDHQQACDYSHMQPCPASARETVDVDTSKLADGLYQLKAFASDAADQSGSSTAVLKVDHHAPAPPVDLAVQRNADATMALTWTNPDQGDAAPVAGVNYAVCSALGVDCTATAFVAGSGISRLSSVAIPAGQHVVKVWLQDEAGNADPANAATLTVDPTTIEAPNVLQTLPPVLGTGSARAPTFKFTKAQRTGSTLTLSGTIAKSAKATITGRVSKGNTTVTAKAKPKKGKWALKLRLTGSLKRSNSLDVTVAYAGEKAFNKSTLRRRLAKKSTSRGSAEDFSVRSVR